MNDATTHPTKSQSPQVAFFVLKDRPQWVAWRYQERNGKLTKPPVNPHTGADADVSDPRTWGTYRQALKRQLADNLPGVGFVFAAGGGLVGVDLDGCLDADGQPAPWAREIVDLLDSYTEISPSGRGLHIITLGALPPGRRRAGPVEMYDSGRYLTYTGRVFEDRWAIGERSEALAQVHARYLAQPRAKASAPAQPALLEDMQILDKLLRSRVGQAAARLWTGDTSGYPSPSEADLALASYLAFYTDDPAQIVRLIRTSALGARAKWQREDYALATAQKAIANRAGRYDPAWTGGVR